MGEENLKCSIRKQRARKEEEPAWDFLSDLENRRGGFHRTDSREQRAGHHTLKEADSIVS